MYLSRELAALALIPGLLIIVNVYCMDKVEKEPVGLIFKLLMYGVISCICAGYIERFLSGLYPQYPQGSLQYALTTAFGLAALVEETVKYLALRIASWNHPSFNYRFDGIVYGVSAAVGFAVYENLNYVAVYGFQTGIVRAFTAVPLHAFCGVFMGVFYAYSKKAAIVGENGLKTICTLLALLVPMLIHGVYDALAMWNNSTAQMVFYVVLIALYIAGITVNKKMSRKDRYGSFYPKARTIEYDSEIYE